MTERPADYGHPERNEVEPKDLPYRLSDRPQYRWKDSSLTLRMTVEQYNVRIPVKQELKHSALLS